MPLMLKHDTKIWFIHIPKTGGTSIVANLREMGVQVKHIDEEPVAHGVTLQHLTPEQLDHRISHWKNYPAFAVMRDPWHRTQSEYHYQRALGLTQHESMEDWLVQKLRAYRKDNSVDDNHIRPQVDFIREDTRVFSSVRASRYWLNDLFGLGRGTLWRRHKNVTDYKKISLKHLDRSVRELWNDLYHEDVVRWKELTK